MELCKFLRLIFKSTDSQTMQALELQEIINKTLNKNYSAEQINIGLEYSGFKKVKGSYFIELNKSFDISNFDAKSV